MTTPQIVSGSLSFEADPSKAYEALDSAKTVLHTLEVLGAKYAVRVELTPAGATKLPPPIVNLYVNGNGRSATPNLDGPYMPYDDLAAGPPSEANPTTAAPETEEPPANAIEALAARIRDGHLKFKAVAPELQERLVETMGVYMMASTMRPPTKEEWNTYKPEWMPTAHALSYWQGGRTWLEWQTRFERLYETRRVTSSGE